MKNEDKRYENKRKMQGFSKETVALERPHFRSPNTGESVITIQFSPAPSRVKWLKREKINVSKTMSVILFIIRGPF
jgi:hypothetical protein